MSFSYRLCSSYFFLKKSALYSAQKRFLNCEEGTVTNVMNTEKLMKNTLQSCTGKMHDFYPYPAATDRDSYPGLPDTLKKQIISDGEACVGFTYPYISATDYMAFKRIGNRTDFEAPYFAKRSALNRLVLAECVEYQGRFLDDIVNGIFAICDEAGWQLPAHNAYIRDTEQFPLPDVTRPVLDLFACETGAQMACILYLLGEKLNEVSPFIPKRIMHELEKRIVTPYLTEHFWWMGNGDEPMCNWTVWCTQNILLTFFLTAQSETDRKFVLEKAAKSCDFFLKDYGTDGCCEEGAQYYRHAGLCLFNALEVLQAVTNGGFTTVYQEPKIKNIADYIRQMHVSDKYYFNFADCSPVAGRAGVREYLFGLRTMQPALSSFAAKDFVAGGSKLSTEEINLFYRVQELFTYEEITTKGNALQNVPVEAKQDLYYPSVGLFLTESKCFALAVKAGDNNDSHNHNDTGSFTIYMDGNPLFVDIGVESYTAKTFSDRRYEIWTMQSGYHNLPVINGLDQCAGEAYRATNVTVTSASSETCSSVSMHLENAYSLQDSSVFYMREVKLDKSEECILIQDSSNAKDVILNFITYEKPDLENSEIHIGSMATASFSGAKPLGIELLPITDPRLKTAWDHDLYRIRLQMTAETFRMEIRPCKSKKV